MPRLASLSLELLHTFVSLAHNAGDAAKTTRQLGINQPSMSKRLRYFQHADGRVLPRPWLVLEGKTWTLTEEGRRALPAAEEIIKRYQELTRFLTASGAIRPELRFACGQEAAAGLVLQAVLRFRREHPEARLRISTLRGSARIAGVANGSLDLASVTHDEVAIQRIARRRLHVDTIARDPLALVCAEDFPEATRLRKWPKTKAPPTAFLGYPLILPAPDAGIRKGVDRGLRRAGVLAELNVALEVGGWPTILAYVRAGLGVGLVSRAAVPESGSLIVRGLDPEAFPPIETKVICRRLLGTGEDLDLTADARAFRDCLFQAASRRSK
jgi:DNA-binding transcriptional LysR family regulator